MTIKQALKHVDKDRLVLDRALSALGTVRALYAVGEFEKAIDLYGAIRSDIKLAFRSFPARDGATCLNS